MHISLHFTNIHIYNDGWFIYGLILPLVMKGVSQLPISGNAFDVDAKSDIESNAKSDAKSKKPLEQVIGFPSNQYNLSL